MLITCGMMRIEHILALSSPVVDIECSAFQYVRDAKELKADELDRVSTISDQGHCTQKVLGGNRGRLRYDVQEAQLQFFVEFGFKVSEMMSDSELDEIVKNVFSTQWLSCYPCDTTVNGVSYAGVACKRVFAKSRY
ncbi:hypothetical protein pdam_00021633 [Pocillopora damicornis]|uniref:Uncharacterized protein n=1 Tax=Pocillopora damicornis TaxID=46731 RepID=A0A3M6US09_POCDA|nr:hypothetical protein pdam_00021633 [Pocillopora damicornis]